MVGQRVVEVMTVEDEQALGGTAQLWGPLFGRRAGEWAKTWEGPQGWGTPAYEYVLERARVSDGSEVLDCGCGAGRFARMAADLGARVSGVDASAELIDIAAERTPEGDFRVGDLETLPWGDESFDLVTGFSVFQFADDKVQAISEAGRVSRGPVAVVVPTRVSESGLAEAFKPLFPLFPPAGLARLKQSGIFALSEPGRLEEVLAAAGTEVEESTDIECPAVFENVETAVRAFLGAGPTMLAINHSGEEQVAEAVRDGIGPYTDPQGRVTLPGWYRAVFIEG